MPFAKISCRPNRFPHATPDRTESTYARRERSASITMAHRPAKNSWRGQTEPRPSGRDRELSRTGFVANLRHGVVAARRKCNPAATRQVVVRRGTGYSPRPSQMLLLWVGHRCRGFLHASQHGQASALVTAPIAPGPRKSQAKSSSHHARPSMRALAAAP